MVSSVLPGLVCVLCVILLPAVWADYCSSYVDSDGYSHQAQQCGSQFCCGSCDRKYCCSDRRYYLSKDNQQYCTGSPPKKGKNSRIATLLGTILGSVIPIILVVGLIICCVAPCCFLYKKLRKGKGRNRRPHTTNTTTVVTVPDQPHPTPGYQPNPTPGYQPSYPGYQPVPAQPGYGGLPNPSAPPSYMDSINPGHTPGHPGMPMVPYPGQPYAPPPHSNEFAPMPYNPNYSSNP